MEDSLNEKVEAMTKTILDGVDSMHTETRQQALRDKQELFDKTSEVRAELLDKLAPRKALDDHETRIKNLEEQIA